MGEWAAFGVGVGAGAVGTGLIGLYFITSYNKLFKKEEKKIPEGIDLIYEINLEGMVMPSPDSTPRLPQLLNSSKKLINLETTKKQIENAIDNDAKGLLLKINTPGGHPGIADLVREYIANIDEHVHRYRKKDLDKEEAEKLEKLTIPTIAYIETCAASAGCLIATAANKTCIAPMAIGGSIGVINAFPTILDFLQEWGVKAHVIRKGKYKGMGMPMVDVTPEMEKQLEKNINEIYDWFVTTVSESRNVSREVILKIAEGHGLNAKEALDNGLVDKIGYYNDAVEMFKEYGLKNPHVEEANIKTSALGLGGLMYNFVNTLGTAIGNAFGEKIFGHSKYNNEGPMLL